MRNVANFVLFNACWFVAVEGAARGSVWAGAIAFGAMVVHHLLWLTPAPERGRELRYLLAVGLAGTVLDTALSAGLGLIAYPTSAAAWPFAVVPPWITALWVGFATMPRLSLGWLAALPWGWAVFFGAVGGPLSFYGGTHLGPIAPGGELLPTLGALAVEYGLLMPLMLRLAPAHGAAAVPTPSDGGDVAVDAR